MTQIYYNINLFIISKALDSMILSVQEEHLNDSHCNIQPFGQQYQGNIRKLCLGYYSNPQIAIFGCTYFLSVFMAVIMATQVFIFGYHNYVGKFLCFYILYRYANLAFSNPGLARQNPIKIMENYRFCTVCSIHVRKFTRHCDICKVCVDAYDHHCIFIGKCIGGGNMGQFKQFLCVIFSTLIYAIVVSIMYSTNIQQVGAKDK